MAISFFFTLAFSRFQGFRSYITFRPQVLGWAEIIWSVTLLRINLVRGWYLTQFHLYFCRDDTLVSPKRVKQSCLYLPQRKLYSSSQRIMGRIIKELSYNETVELDGSLWSTSFVDLSHNCSRTQNLFTQNVYSIKDVINVPWLSGWDAFKTWYLASSKVEPACYK